MRDIESGVSKHYASYDVLSRIRPDMEVLDISSGISGPAWMIAARYSYSHQTWRRERMCACPR